MSLDLMYLEFGGKRLAVRCAIPEVLAFLETSYCRMMSPGGRAADGVIELKRLDRGFRLTGSVSNDFACESPDALFPLLKEEVLTFFISSRPDLLWVHGAAVEHDNSAVILIGPSGSGKSTLATRLVDLGWKSMSDDVSPIDVASLEVIPFAETPHRRKPAGGSVAVTEVGDLEKEFVNLHAGDVRDSPASIAGLIFPTFRPGENEQWESLANGQAAMELLRNVKNLGDIRAAGVDASARLVMDSPSFSLIFSHSVQAARSIAGRF